MANVHLQFEPGDRPGYTKLLVYEALGQDDSFPLTLIDTITNVGVYPDYISEVTANDATSLNNWFAIRWEDADGVQSDISERVQGLTQTLVGKIVRRVMLGNSTLNENIVVQAAQYVVSVYMNAPDPMAVLDSEATVRQLEGMTLVTQARAELRGLVGVLSSASSSWTAGLVSMKAATGSGTNVSAIKDSIDMLMKEGMKILGVQYSIVAQMVVPEIAGGLSEVSGLDISRLELVEIDP